MDPLLLIPTELEAGAIRRQLEPAANSARIELCGGGPIVAAARTMQLLEQVRPRQVILLGLAGSMPSAINGPADAPLCIGHAYEFTSLVYYGLGAGSGDDFRSAWELGWQAWDSAPELALRERFDLQPHTSAMPRTLLSCSAVSATAADVDRRLALYPDAQAEDMEGYSVAVACRLAGVPLRIIRGISNCAGDRRHAQWQIQPALAAAAQLWLSTQSG